MHSSNPNPPRSLRSRTQRSIRPVRRALRPLLGLLLLASVTAGARPFRVDQLPNGAVFGCANCHVSANGGGARNAFGQAVGSITGSSSRQFWTATLAGADSDRDGAANGVELGDPDGDGTPIDGAAVTNPGNANSKPPSNVAPTVAVTAPTAAAVFAAPAVTEVSADAADSDGSVAQVEFFSNGRSLGVVKSAPYKLLVDWALGNHVITARATDNAGAAATSAEVAMTVNPSPAPTLEAPLRDGSATILNWREGGGPFVVESKTAIVDPWCGNGTVVTGRTASVTSALNANVYRVVDLAGQSGIPLTATLSGEFERPNPVATGGSGSGRFEIVGNTLTFHIDYTGLSGPATLAHIHGPAGMDASTGVLIDLAPFNGGAFGTSGSLTGAVALTTINKAALLSGLTYVNIHTEANRPGEIRGQILPVLHQVVMNGAHERPTPVNTSASGSGLFLLEGNQLKFAISYRGLSGVATAAHIHGPADTEGTAGPIIDLAPFNGGAFGVDGGFSGTVTLTAAQLTAIASGLAYVNVHTDANRPGEIRGQIRPNVHAAPFLAELNGANERPNPVTTTATGLAILALAGDQLFVEVRYAGLSGAATAAHLHGPADANGTASPMIDFATITVGGFAPTGSLAGVLPASEAVKTALREGNTYVNVHTAANRPGEIRGQALPPSTP